MQVGVTTTTALLEGLLDPASERTWSEFDARFRPILRAFSIRLGLSESDAEDVTQEALTRFVRFYRAGKYDRTRGRLSSWLVSITQNCVFDLQASRNARLERRGESAIGELSESSELTSIWNEECRRVLLERAMGELRKSTRLEPQTIRAFEMLAFEQREAAGVAAELELSLDSVYAAKNRCLTQLREIIARFNEAYELD